MLTVCNTWCSDIYTYIMLKYLHHTKDQIMVNYIDIYIHTLGVTITFTNTLKYTKLQSYISRCDWYIDSHSESSQSTR